MTRGEYEGMPAEVITEYLKKNNMSYQDVSYASDASKNTDEKLAFITQNIKDRSQLLKWLQEGRTKSLGGDYRANPKLLRTLRDDGVLSNSEYYGLLNIVDGKYQSKATTRSTGRSGGSRRKASKFGSYKLYASGVNPLSYNKSLRSLLENARLS